MDFDEMVRAGGDEDEVSRLQVADGVLHVEIDVPAHKKEHLAVLGMVVFSEKFGTFFLFFGLSGHMAEIAVLADMLKHKWKSFLFKG